MLALQPDAQIQYRSLPSPHHLQGKRIGKIGGYEKKKRKQEKVATVD